MGSRSLNTKQLALAAMTSCGNEQIANHATHEPNRLPDTKGLFRFPSAAESLPAQEQLLHDLEQANADLRELAALAKDALRELETVKAQVRRMMQGSDVPSPVKQ